MSKATAVLFLCTFYTLSIIPCPTGAQEAYPFFNLEVGTSYSKPIFKGLGADQLNIVQREYYIQPSFDVSRSTVYFRFGTTVSLDYTKTIDFYNSGPNALIIKEYHSIWNNYCNLGIHFPLFKARNQLFKGTLGVIRSRTTFENSRTDYFYPNTGTLKTYAGRPKSQDVFSALINIGIGTRKSWTRRSTTKTRNLRWLLCLRWK